MENPTQVDKFINERIKHYPSLFNNRTETLVYILCVLGNGYEWVDGIPFAEDDVSVPWTPEREWESFNNIYGDLSDDEVFKKIGQKKVERMTQIVENSETLSRTKSDEVRSVGSQSDSILIMNMPDNVENSWREACDEIKILMEQQHGWVF